MATDPIEADVCVIGGGPAGSTFALRLSRLGHKVLLVERAAFPRRHLGEVLTPGVWRLLDALRLAEAAWQLPHIDVARARLRWEGKATVETVASPSAPIVAIDRGCFDLFLLAAAKAAGVRVLQPAVPRPPTATKKGWELDVGTGRGTIRVASRYLADASGRRRVLRGSRTTRSVPTVAIHGRWTGGQLFNPITRLEAGGQGWFWRAQLPDGTVRAFAFVDPLLVRRSGVSGRGIEGLYRQLLASSRLLDDLAGPELIDEAEVCDATSYLDEDPITDRLIRLGDASCAIDPLSSSGVQKALQSALQGSAAAHTILQAGGDNDAAIEFYRAGQRDVYEANATKSAAFYARQRSNSTEAFWRKRRRAEAQTVPLRSNPPLGWALQQQVQLASEASLTAVPCAIGDGVALRRALNHPHLRRPVAFLGGSELAPLLDAIADAPTLADAVGRWQAVIGPRQSLRVADWLYRHGLLEAI